QGHRLTRLVTNILTFARVTDTSEVYSFQRLQVSELVEEALQSFRHITDREQLRIDIQLSPDLPTIRADRTAMVLALDNAIDNVRQEPFRSRTASSRFCSFSPSAPTALCSA